MTCSGVRRSQGVVQKFFVVFILFVQLRDAFSVLCCLFCRSAVLGQWIACNKCALKRWDSNDSCRGILVLALYLPWSFKGPLENYRSCSRVCRIWLELPLQMLKGEKK